MLSIAGLFALSAFWDHIRAILVKAVTPPKPVPRIDPPAVIVDNGGHKHECDEDSLCSLVVCWETLRDELHERGLYQAEEEVEKIFPLFVEDSMKPLPPPPRPAPNQPSTPEV